jgi:hypothetical protein
VIRGDRNATLHEVPAARRLALLATAEPVLAHHAFGAEFDRDAPIKLQGRIVKLEWVNSHTRIHLDVVKEDGTTETWAVEGGTPNVLLRRGLRRDCLSPGIGIIVDGYQAKDLPEAGERARRHLHGPHPYLARLVGHGRALRCRSREGWWPEGQVLIGLRRSRSTVRPRPL